MEIQSIDFAIRGALCTLRENTRKCSHSEQINNEINIIERDCLDSMNKCKDLIKRRGSTMCVAALKRFEEQINEIEKINKK